MRVAIAIMAGGESRRMGRDKALLDFRGEGMLARVTRLAMRTGRDVVVIGRERPEGWDAGDDLPFLPDEQPGQGPLGGLVTALRHCRRPVLVLPCDLPLLNDEALRWLLDRARHGIAGDGIITLNAGRPEPLFSLYGVSALPLAEMLLAQGMRSMRELHRAGAFDTVELPDAFSPMLRNVNTPEQLQEAEKLAGPK